MLNVPEHSETMSQKPDKQGAFFIVSERSKVPQQMLRRESASDQEFIQHRAGHVREAELTAIVFVR